MRLISLGFVLSFGLLAGIEPVRGDAPGASTLSRWFGGDSSKPAEQTADPQPPPRDDTRHYLRQTTCNIPFTIDTAKAAPLELQLFVSVDRGASWKFYGKAAPGTGSFAFRATQDGEYWFALRTIEKTKLPPDPSTLQPGLKMVVDTHQPEFEFQSEIVPNGDVRMSWKAIDPNLLATSLKIEYQTGPEEPWRPVTLPANVSSIGAPLTGSYAFRPESPAESLTVRAEIQDRAGNNSVVTRNLAHRTNSASRPASVGNMADARDPGSAMADGSTTWPRDNVLPARTQKAPPTYGELPPPKPSAENMPSSVTNDSGNRYFVSTSPGSGPETVTGPQTSIPSSPIPNPPAAASEATVIPTPAPSPAGTVPLPQGEYPGSSTPVRSNAEPTQPSGPPQSDVELPTGEMPRMTSARRFNLDYEIDAVGPASVAKVELWGTSDGGRSWTCWMEDSDIKSPVEVEVGRDGVYGFRVVIVASNHLSSPTPQPGEAADIWVGVDTTRPNAQITSATYGEGQHAGQLDIRWHASDSGFPDRPITLSFSEQANGPWTTIAAGLPNTGQYYWAVEPRIPRQIFLRIEAQDEAGNLGEHQITEPISTAGLVPHGRIRGILTTPSNNRSASLWPDLR